MRLIKRWANQLVAATIVVVLGLLVAGPRTDSETLKSLVSGLHFATPQPFKAVPGVPLKYVRAVHPAYTRISAWMSVIGTSAALGDADGDGLANDVCLVDPRTDLVTLEPAPGTLGRNGGARYEKIVLDPNPLPYNPAVMAPQGCLFADLNEDGWTDLVVYFWGRTPIVYLQIPGNSGLTRKSFKAVELVAKPDRWYTSAATIADFDGDGHADLLFAGYFADNVEPDFLDASGTGKANDMHTNLSHSFNGGLKHFLLWKEASGGSDPDVKYTHEMPLADDVNRGWTLAAAAGDLDGDLLPEVYLANDFGPDRLLHNQSSPGKLHFVVDEGQRGLYTPKSFVLGRDSFKSMGVDFADINNDGHFDIFVSNITQPYGAQESNFAWINTGDTGAMARGIAPFTQLAYGLGLASSGWPWDAKLADLDNDGQLEAMQASGYLKGKVNRWPEIQSLATANEQMMTNPELWPRFRPGDDLSGDQWVRIYKRDGNGHFWDIAEQLGLKTSYDTRAIAVGDVDGDGLLDLVYANQWEDSLYLHNECSKCGAFIGFHLVRDRQLSDQPAKAIAGLPANLRFPPAVGAAVTVTTSAGKKFVAQMDGGNGHGGHRSSDVHVGLGQVPLDEQLQVEIAWRTFKGEPRRTTLKLKPGWNTIVLGS